MTPFDYLLLAIAAVALLYQINLLRRSKREITIPGTAPNRKTVAILVGILLVLAIWRTGNLAQSWPVFVLIGVTCIAVFAGSSGLTPEGMFSNGRYIPFSQASFYEIEQRGGDTVFRLSKMTREGQMKIDPQQEDAIVALMEENNIPRQAAYQKNMARKAGQRAAARQKHKKKK